jgi:CRP-like cAMP-binding protein
MSDAIHSSNRLLSALPVSVQQRLARHLEPTELVKDQFIYHPDMPIETSYFLTRGLVALVKTMRDGRTVEIGAIGIEGVTGPDVLFGIPNALLECRVRVPGTAMRIPSELLRREVERSEPVRIMMARFVKAIFSQIAQTAACNRLHSMEQRCSRWLLTAHDSAGSDTFSITHEFLAMLLGVQRSGLTLRIRALQDSALVRCGRGRITILDRTGLSARSCECYGVIRGEVDQIFTGPRLP